MIYIMYIYNIYHIHIINITYNVDIMYIEHSLDREE